MEYEQIDEMYRDDVIADAMYSREIEYFHYDFDRINFEFLLTCNIDDNYRKDIEQRLGSTIFQMSNVEKIYSALKAQITDELAHKAAVQRAILKRRAHVDK